MGIRADIQTISLNDSDTYHRVRVGPFGERRAVEEVRKRLSQKGIETRIIKIAG